MWGSGVLTGKPSAGPAESDNSQSSDGEPAAPWREALGDVVVGMGRV